MNDEDIVDLMERSAQTLMEAEKMTAFQKKDAGKPCMELVDPTALLDLAAVLTMGAEKYEANGWRNAINDPSAEGRIIGALLRHVAAHQRGETFDAESGLPHAAHVMCNAMFLDWLVRERQVPRYTFTPDVS